MPPVLPPCLAASDLCRALDISDRTLRRRVRAGRVPAPTRLRKNFHVWPWESVRPLIERRESAEPCHA
jgi:hypothetical protein